MKLIIIIVSTLLPIITECVEPCFMVALSLPKLLRIAGSEIDDVVSLF